MANIGKERVTDVQIDSATSDLTLSFGSDLRLQIVNNSSGGEAWSFSSGGLQVIGRNGIRLFSRLTKSNCCEIAISQAIAVRGFPKMGIALQFFVFFVASGFMEIDTDGLG